MIDAVGCAELIFVGHPDFECDVHPGAMLAFGQLLKALEGISSGGNGCIVIITTNHVGKLDPVLI